MNENQDQKELSVFMPDWATGVKEQSVKTALEYGEILPSVELPEINQTILVKFLEEPKEITHKNFPQGKATIGKVQHQGADMQLIIPNSLSFGIVKEMNRLNLTSLVDVKMIVGAKFTDMSDKGYNKQTKVYWCQIKGTEEGA